MDHEQVAAGLERLAQDVRANPPYEVEFTDQNAVSDVPPDRSGNYNWVVKESGGRLETVVRIRWQP